MNKVTLIGRLTEDPKLVESAKGGFVRFTLVTNEKGYTTKNGTVVEDTADFHNCICFGGSATYLARYGVKGSMTVVDGKITHGQYQNKENVTVYTTTISANEVQVLFPPKQQGSTYDVNQSKSSQNSYQQKPVSNNSNVRNNVEPVAPPRQNGNTNDLPF